MKKVISLLLVLALCFCLACTAFAEGTGDDFVSSPGVTEPTECDHEHTKVVGQKDPTCEEDGYTGDTVCEDCGEVIKEGEKIPAHGHDYDDDGTCIHCGEQYTPPTGDNSMITLWIVLMAVAVVGMVGVGVAYRKNH